MCRSRREHSNAYLLAKFGLDTAENEPCQVCPTEQSRPAQGEWHQHRRAEPAPPEGRPGDRLRQAGVQGLPGGQADREPLIGLERARSRLYRGQILQQNMRWKALAEIYTMHSFAQLCNLKNLSN